MKTKNLLTLLLIGITTASAATITLTPSTANPTVGSNFTITLAVTGNTDEVLGFGLNYTLSNAGIVLQSTTINPFFGSDLGLGNPQVSAITFPGATTSTVNLVTFSFLASSAGPSTFSVTSDLKDPNQGVFFLNSDTADLTSSSTINVAPSSVPEPGTLSLTMMGVALSGVVIRRRRA